MRPSDALENAPVGMKLWSPLFGDIIFEGIGYDGIICFAYTQSDGTIEHDHFYSGGQWYNKYDRDECVVFPSWNHQCWWDFKLEDYIENNQQN